MKRILVEVAIAAIMLGAIAFLINRNKALKSSGEQDARNMEALLTDIERYKVRDSLNAARCGALELTLDQYRRYRADDAALIRELRSGNDELQRVTSIQAATIMELRCIPRDTVIIRDSLEIPAIRLDVHDRWYDFSGVVTDDGFMGTCETRDSLLVIETRAMSKCLFRKLRKIKDTEIEVISKNPHTTIAGLEHIIIER